jgi:phosphomannomutase / phosphoglucomutase
MIGEEEFMVKINKTMFREYDIRGIAKEDQLSFKTVNLIGRAYGTFLRRRGIAESVLGRDSRISSPDFHAAFKEGLLVSGIKVLDIGMVLTPIMYFSQYLLKIKGGAMITGSHNPKEWNGFKLASGYSSTLIDTEIKEILKIIEEDKFIRGTGSCENCNVIEEYAKDLCSRVDIKKNLKIVLDCGNGTAGAIAPDIFRRAGIEVIEQFCDIDPEFPNHEPDPALVKTVEAISKNTIANKADVGIGLDGDGDRLGVIDEKGNNIWPDRFMILLSRQILQRKPGAKIVFDVKCSQALVDDIKAHGGIPIMWKTGHSHIKSKLHSEKADLAGEMSGHIFFVENYYGYDDGVYAALRFLEYISDQDKTVSELMETTPQYISTPAINVACPDEKKYDVVDRLTKEFKKEYSVIDINGARVQFGDGWGLVRASSNLPILVLRFEAKFADRIEEYKKIFKEKFSKFPEISTEWENE